MRLLVLFLVCSIGLSYAADSYAQKAMISIDVHNQRVEDILKEIEAQSDFDFFFNNKHVDLNRRVSVSADKSNIFSVLKEIFAGTNVKYSVLDKKIILSVEAQSPQQEKKVTVSGTVLDTHGEPVIGASVLEKGVQGNGTITDIDGIFKLSVSSSKAQLDISYIGYQSQTVAVQVGKNLKIILQEDSKQLEEVVVVGYGTQSKKTLTGAVSMVNMGDVEMNTVPNVSRALAGKAAGFRVNQISAQPGGEAKFRIRGEASTGAGNDPLFVIDGFPVSSSGNLSSGNGYYESGNIDNVLESLNPDDIESISVLKDAASTALWGSRGANGVVMVTTKRGQKGKPKITFEGRWGINQATNNRADLMDIPQSYEWAWQSIYNSVRYGSDQPYTTNAGNPNMKHEEAALFASQHLFNYNGGAGFKYGSTNGLGNWMHYNVPGATYTNTGTSSTMTGAYLVGTDGKLNPNAQFLGADNWDDIFLKNKFRKSTTFLSAAQPRTPIITFRPVTCRIPLTSSAHHSTVTTCVATSIRR